MSYSRVTILGTRRRLAILPSDEPVGRLLPDLLDEAVCRPPRPGHLVTRSGAALPEDVSLGQDGTDDRQQRLPALVVRVLTAVPAGAERRA